MTNVNYSSKLAKTTIRCAVAPVEQEGGKFREFPIKCNNLYPYKQQSLKIFRRNIKLSENPTISAKLGAMASLSPGHDAPGSRRPWVTTPLGTMDINSPSMKYSSCGKCHQLYTNYIADTKLNTYQGSMIG